MDAKIRQAAKKDVDLIIFPELFLSGYNVGEAPHQNAEAQDGPFARRVAAQAKELNIAIGFGYPERDGDTATRGRHDWFATGSNVLVFRFKDATVAVLICYECEFPEIMRHAALEGAQIVLVATAGGEEWEQVPIL